MSLTIVVLAVVPALLGGCSGGAKSQAMPASCVGPYLRADQAISPPPPGQPTTLGDAHPEQSVTVYGHAYFSGSCHDTTGSVQRDPAGSVPLMLTTANHLATNLVIAHPGSDGAFAATVTIPADAASGPATITDGQGHEVDLVIMTD